MSRILTLASTGLMAIGLAVMPVSVFAQSANDIFVFGTVDVTSFSSGAIHAASGWNAVNLTVVPFLIVALGLVIWHNAKNLVRLARTDMNNGGRAITSCYLQVFQDGEKVFEQAPIVPDTPTHLRLARLGNRVTAAYSQDGGKTWHTISSPRVELPDSAGVLRVIEVRGDRITLAAGGRGAAARAPSARHLERHLAVLVLHDLLDVLIRHDLVLRFP